MSLKKRLKDLIFHACFVNSIARLRQVIGAYMIIQSNTNYMRTQLFGVFLAIGVGLYLLRGIGANIFLAWQIIFDGYFDAPGHLFTGILYEIFICIANAIIGFWAVSVCYRTQNNLKDLKPVIVFVGLGIVLSALLYMATSFSYAAQEFHGEYWLERVLSVMVYSVAILTLLGYVFYCLSETSDRTSVRNGIFLSLILAGLLQFGMSVYLVFDGSFADDFLTQSIRILPALFCFWAAYTIRPFSNIAKHVISVLLTITILIMVFGAFPMILKQNAESDFGSISTIYSMLADGVYLVPLTIFMVFYLYQHQTKSS